MFPLVTASASFTDDHWFFDSRIPNSPQAVYAFLPPSMSPRVCFGRHGGVPGLEGRRPGRFLMLVCRNGLYCLKNKIFQTNHPTQPS